MNYDALALDEIQRLRQQLAEVSALNTRLLAEYEGRMTQLAECELERDELKQWLEDQVCEAKDFAYKLESKTIELSTVTKERDELVKALKQFAECDLNDGNCASLEVATRRIRSLAQAALAKLGADKGEV